MNIRNATMEDLEILTAIEAACFPPAEAATRESFAKRLAVYPNHFWLLEEDGQVVSFVNGMVTDEPLLRDEMFEDAALHNEDGAWQMIFGVNTLPEYRRRGLAGVLLERAAADARAQGRKGCVLTCKDRLIHYYEKFGYRKEGVSQSVHGGVVWYDMRLTFGKTGDER
ncbi:GNAT family N-acetyltransferase [Dysosmobacter sp. HCP28S3_G4]|uniref:GNAT family N-acetyltransferase n=1 Tax=Dysosmobacter sp. HCP28S3_G4 TaxID=3438938 RepID=UPI003F8B3AD3